MNRIKENIGKVLVGKEDVIDLVLTSLIAGGHVLLEDVPGTGKTMFAKTLAKCLNLDMCGIDIISQNIENPENTEYKILELLTIHIGKVLTYSDIISKIWGYNDSGSIKKLQVNIANIRKKLGEKPGEYIYILNDLGVGYRMNDELEV